jgi:Domain of unknown function (DUF4386)
MLSTKGAFMRPPSNLGRVAGIWYLLLIAIGPFFLIYVPGKLYVKRNAAATIANIAAHERLFRFGILAELIGGIILIFLVLAFYRLFLSIAFSAPLPGRLAWHRRHRLVKLELCGDPSAGIPK